MPEHLGVTQIVVVVPDNRVARETCKVNASISAVGNALLLLAIARRGVKSYHGIGSEACSIVLVDDTRTTEDITQIVAHQGYSLLFPVNKIGTGGMAP